jgi:hypothetical protein
LLLIELSEVHARNSLRSRKHYATTDKTDDSHVAREIASRVEDMDPVDLDCVLGDDEDDRNIESTSFDYWYMVESTDNYPDYWLKLLERMIFHEVEGSASWCYTPVDDVTRDGSNRQLTRARVPMKYLDEDRRLGVLSFTSSPKDRKTNSKCTSCLHASDNDWLVSKHLIVSSTFLPSF